VHRRIVGTLMNAVSSIARIPVPRQSLASSCVIGLTPIPCLSRPLIAGHGNASPLCGLDFSIPERNPDSPSLTIRPPPCTSKCVAAWSSDNRVTGVEMMTLTDRQAVKYPCSRTQSESLSDIVKRTDWHKSCTLIPAGACMGFAPTRYTG